jgi:hypothetical protein
MLLVFFSIVLPSIEMANCFRSVRQTRSLFTHIEREMSCSELSGPAEHTDAVVVLHYLYEFNVVTVENQYFCIVVD